jgi:hypothetical protein
VQFRLYDMIPMILRRSNKLLASDSYAVDLAVMNGDLKMVQLLLNDRKYSSKDLTMFFAAAIDQENGEEILQFLYDEIVNIRDIGLNVTYLNEQLLEGCSVKTFQFLLKLMPTYPFDDLIFKGRQEGYDMEEYEKLMTEKEPTKPIDWMESLKTAIMSNNLHQLIIRLRAANPEDVNYDELIAYARDYERDNIVEYLLREKGSKKQRIQRQIK